MIKLTSTITNEDHNIILWPGEEVVFTCQTRGLILEWTSDDYIGESDIALEFFVYIDNLGDMKTTQSSSMAILTSVDHVMTSELRIRASSQFPTSTVACTNVNGTSKNITFSVLGTLHKFCVYTYKWAIIEYESLLLNYIASM